MKGLFYLAFKSLWNRKVTSLLTILSIALSVCLFLGVEKTKEGTRDAFGNTVSQTDLIVGAKASPLQLLLYSVFHMGEATQNISIESFDRYTSHPAVGWTIPISLGDSHKGHRVVATNSAFYKNYRFHFDKSVEFAEGKAALGVFDVVLGSDVAQKLKYKLQQSITLSHGIEAEAFYEHEDKKFQVVGILARTGTPLDRALFISLEGMEALHHDWQDGSPSNNNAPPLKVEDLEPKSITSFLLRTKNRVATLRLQREIETYGAEPLMAVVPGLALARLWETLSYGERALQGMSVFVIIIGFLGMLLSLYSSLEGRRREMAILRALGASPLKILFLFLIESLVLVGSGILLGCSLVYGFLYLLRPWIASHFGLYLPIEGLSSTEVIYLFCFFIAGCLFGLLPAIRAYKNSLADGLMLKV